MEDVRHLPDADLLAGQGPDDLDEGYRETVLIRARKGEDLAVIGQQDELLGLVPLPVGIGFSEDLHHLGFGVGTEPSLPGRQCRGQARAKEKEKEESEDCAVDRAQPVGYNAPCFAKRG
jgi:hypothetical protein